MKKLFSFFAFISVLVFLSSCSKKSEPIVRVRIIENEKLVSVRLIDDWKLSTTDNELVQLHTDDKIEIKNLDDTIIVILNNKDSIKTSLCRLIPDNSTSTIDIFDVAYGKGWWWGGKQDRNYSGEIEFRNKSKQGIDVIVKLPIEEYLKGVIPYEIGGDSPIEALKAQAVAARSEAMSALKSKLYGGEHYDLTSDVECQVFSGNKKRTKNSDLAVNETRGLILTENNEVINAYYSSNCGGHSETIKNVWPDRKESESYKVSFTDSLNSNFSDLSDKKVLELWLTSSPNVLCNPEINKSLPEWSKKNFRWKREITNENLSDKRSNKILNIIPMHRGESGRITKLKIEFADTSVFLNGELNIRMAFTPTLRSSSFIVKKIDNQFLFIGAGWGHGVGMCQSGAVTLANNNHSFKEILNHYYRKAKITKTY